MKPPYRTFAVNYVTLPREFSMLPQNDGRHTGAIEFSTLVYDADGNLLNISGTKLDLNLTPDAYRRFVTTPLRVQLAVSAPVKQESFLRIVVHDVSSNHYGVVEIPTAEVAHLSPLEPQGRPDAAVKPGVASSPQSPGAQ